MIRVRSISLSELQEFIKSEEYLLLDNIPVSPQRASSYLENPKTTENDIVLFLAYEQGNLVGYRTVLPDSLIAENKVIPFAWLSGSWALPEKRRQGISTLLLEHALEAWDYKIMFTNYAPESKAVYDKSGEFTKYASIDGIRVYLRFLFSEVLPPKSKLFKKLEPVLKLSDYVLNGIADVRFKREVSSITQDQIRIKEINTLDEKTIEFITKRSYNNFTCQKISDLKWIKAHPWIQEKKQAGINDKKYYFSSSSHRYINIQLEVYGSDNRLVAYLMIIVIGNKLTLPYCYYSGESYKLIPDIVFSNMIQYKLSYATIYHPEVVNEILKQKKGYIYKKTIPRHYYCSVGLLNNLPDPKTIKWQDGEGDAAFT